MMLLKNSYWTTLIVCDLLIITVMQLMATGATYYSLYILNDMNYVSLILMTNMIPTVLIMFAMPFLTEKFGKRNVFAAGLVIAIIRLTGFGLCASSITPMIMFYALLIPFVCNKEFPFKPNGFLILSNDFGARPEELYEVTMHDMDEVIKSSEEVRSFCIERGAKKAKANLLALFIEEMAGNTVEHGYGKGKKASVDLRFVFHDDSRVIRLRDDGNPFDPVKWLDKNSGDDPASGLGIRVVTSLAKNVNYMASMEMNNIIIEL